MAIGLFTDLGIAIALERGTFRIFDILKKKTKKQKRTSLRDIG